LFRGIWFLVGLNICRLKANLLTTISRIAGGHTTSSTLTLFFFHVLHNPHVLEKLTDELDRELPLLGETEVPYAMSQLEKTLVYEMACVRENFRLTPVFTMTLPRVVTNLGGIEIDGSHVPYKVCSYKRIMSMF
jgi:cytochrome P450